MHSRIGGNYEFLIRMGVIAQKLPGDKKNPFKSRKVHYLFAVFARGRPFRLLERTDERMGIVIAD